MVKDILWSYDDIIVSILRILFAIWSKAFKINVLVYCMEKNGEIFFQSFIL